MRVVFGDRALELGGIVILPEYQQRGIGVEMIRRAVNATDAELLSAFTRNPAILKAMSRVTRNLYPLMDSPELNRLALEIGAPDAVQVGDAVYQVSRYGDEGLYRGFDPAERPIQEGMSLKQRYPELERIGAALVVVGTINEELPS